MVDLGRAEAGADVGARKMDLTDSWEPVWACGELPRRLGTFEAPSLLATRSPRIVLHREPWPAPAGLFRFGVGGTSRRRCVVLPSRGLPPHKHRLEALIPDRLHDVVGSSVLVVAAKGDSDLFEMIDQRFDLIELVEDHASRVVLTKPHPSVSSTPDQVHPYHDQKVVGHHMIVVVFDLSMIWPEKMSVAV